MSSQSVGRNTPNTLIVNQDTSKIFLRNNRYQKGNNINNSSYDQQTMLTGTLMGRVGATGNLVPLLAQATDGSQFPVGILAHDVVIEAGDTDPVTIVDMGDVAEDKIIFFYPFSGNTLDTVPTLNGDSRRLRDYLQAQGIKLISNASEMTAYDNQ